MKKTSRVHPDAVYDPEAPEGRSSESITFDVDAMGLELSIRA